MDFEEIAKQELMWKDLVSRGEILSLQLLAKEAKDDLEKRIAAFLVARKKTIKLGNDTFEFRDKTYSTDTETRDKAMYSWSNAKNVSKRRALLAYRKAETNAWIYKTLLDKKRTSLFKKCKNLVLIGAGMYPYSMFDIQKKYKHIQQVGIEIDKKRSSIGKDLVEKSPAKEHIQIVTCDGNDYDYNYLLEDDLVFISCDVDNKKMMTTIMETCKAHIFICAPYEKTWLRALLVSNKITKKDGITSFLK
jgi:hypothetical protein